MCSQPGETAAHGLVCLHRSTGQVFTCEADDFRVIMTRLFAADPLSPCTTSNLGQRQVRREYACTQLRAPS